MNGSVWGVTALGRRKMVSVFNWSDAPVDREFALPGKSRLKDYWSDEDLGVHTGVFRIKSLPPHSARLIEVVPVR